MLLVFISQINWIVVRIEYTHLITEVELTIHIVFCIHSMVHILIFNEGWSFDAQENNFVNIPEIGKQIEDFVHIYLIGLEASHVYDSTFFIFQYKEWINVAVWIGQRFLTKCFKIAAKR